jgi:hypothetical protein
MHFTAYPVADTLLLLSPIQLAVFLHCISLHCLSLPHAVNKEQPTQVHL